MNLYIAEKPSLGRAIADVLPKPHKKFEGYIQVGNGDCISWCIGHLLEQAVPEIYNSIYKKWRFEHLPIVPEQWKLTPKPKTSKQLSVLRKLIKQADTIIHSGDPDREGQLLVDQVIDYLKASKTKRESAKRLLISDLNPSAVRRAITQIKDNSSFKSLSISALARSRADWLYGINMTRAYTLQGQKVGYNGVLSVGRVQTPLLGLVVRRDEAIKEFTSKPFYEVLAQVKTEAGVKFSAKWSPSSACEQYQDEEGRLLHKPLAEHVIRKVNGKIGEVTNIVNKNKTQSPPLPYNLSALQIDAAKRFSMSAQQVLDACQSLYEKHKLITYPRSSCRYLPEEHFTQREKTCQAISNNSPELQQVVKGSNLSLKSKAWNDSKIEAHHALAPTLKVTSVQLSRAENQVYQLIARQYLYQFYPAYEYSEVRVELSIEGGLFVAKAITITQIGWKVFFSNSKSKQVDNLQCLLPPLEKGQYLQCTKADICEKQTQPPTPFTDATLLAAMTGISHYVSNSEIKKILKETDGLGTEATRAGIIELLFKRELLFRQGKQILATKAGHALIKCLPQIASTPDMTAQWESILDKISASQATYSSLMSPLLQRLTDLVEQSSHLESEQLMKLSNANNGAKFGPSSKKNKYKKRRKK